jgi:hypothetical protein
MSNVVNFRPPDRKPKPIVRKQPNRQPATRQSPNTPRRLTWEPWAGFLAVALVVYFWQYGFPFGG